MRKSDAIFVRYYCQRYARLCLCMGLVICAGAMRAAGQCVEEQELAAVDLTTNDNHGQSVAGSGNTVVVGAPSIPGVLEKGAAYVYVGSGGVWTLQQMLTAADGANDDHFGGDVAISGETIAIGARQHDAVAGNAGAVYVFIRSGVVWTLQQKIQALDAAAGDQFGTSVSIDGDTIVAGAIFDDDGGSNSGAAYVFTRSGVVWSQQQKLTASDPAVGDEFGFSVSVSGDTAVIGSHFDDGVGSNSGSAYVFVRSGVVWSQQQKLTASDAATGDQLGESVSISGESLVAGSPHDDDDGSNSGSAYVFVRSGVVWSEQQKLTASDALAGDEFGDSVSISGDKVLVGATNGDHAAVSSGVAYFYVRNGVVWTEQDKLVASDAGVSDSFGISVSVSGTLTAVGAPGNDDMGSNSGSAYVFECMEPCTPPDCNNHGTCNDGDCNCNVGFVGTACDQCGPDYYNYPTCTFCQAATTCSGNGSCDAFGDCDCEPGWGGTNCNLFNGVPAVSWYGAAVIVLLILTAGTVVFKRRGGCGVPKARCSAP